MLSSQEELMSDIRITASKCPKCDKVIVPPRNLCPYCRYKSTETNLIELGNEGKVLSFTESHKPPEGFNPPLKLALVELEFGAAVLCLGADDFDSTVEIGSRVKLTFDIEKRLRYSLA
ncbi:MAG: Zn-ribbon domain-containing OB-fold protein [Candidatus Thorarchaeota archaeon]|nr:MAG: Zn-ribbon domain-containing OB-fold protein [Candidatus Thorarchaeota archaeon]